MDSRGPWAEVVRLCGCKLKIMKKQAADQSFHDRRYQERKRAEAAKKAPPKKVVSETSLKDRGKSGAS
jgi:hypothetical protein